MTPEEIARHREACRAFIQAHGDRLYYLYERWVDEHEYEDFADYETEMRRLCEGDERFDFRKGTKRPFGFKAWYTPLSRMVEFTVNVKGIGYRFPQV